MSKPFTDDIHEIYGINGVLAILKSAKYKILSIDILEHGIADKNPALKKLFTKYISISNHIPQEVFRKKYAKKHTQGIVIRFNGRIDKDLPRFDNIESNYCLLIIDNVTDPQNMGQIIRTAECAGINGIIIPRRNSVGLTNTVLQVSQGAFSNIPIYSVTNLNQTLKQLKNDGFWTVALENGIRAKPWDTIDYSGKIAIVVGSEGSGIKQLVLNSCDFKATIPMQGKINSLNVSASVAVVVFERLRQIIK
jgi:23S rRNA (guanosine2251-2'-O)-methyltransferase